MIDLEMTRLCAEAMGYTITEPSRLSAPQPSPDAVRVFIGKKSAFWYRPLKDDAQAMALVKKFPMECSNVLEAFACREVSDLNRAIVECVAKMQQVKNAPSS